MKMSQLKYTDYYDNSVLLHVHTCVFCYIKYTLNIHFTSQIDFLCMDWIAVSSLPSYVPYCAPLNVLPMSTACHFHLMLIMHHDQEIFVMLLCDISCNSCVLKWIWWIDPYITCKAKHNMYCCTDLYWHLIIGQMQVCMNIWCGKLLCGIRVGLIWTLNFRSCSESSWFGHLRKHENIANN